MTFFENELKKMFGNSSVMTDIRYVGNALLGRLTDDTIAKISFITGIVHGNYVSALIQVINTKTGEVDRQALKFREIFGLPKEDIHIWDDYGKLSWYCFTPSSQNYKAMHNAAEQYLEMFAEPIQDMQMGM